LVIFEKNMLLNTSIGRLRLVGIAEGISFLVLLGIAMPLKYVAGLPQAVKIFGWMHGLLFILYVVALINAAFVHRWSIWRALVAFVASLVPFGTFALDARLRREERDYIEQKASVNKR
jgi:integral membrane protein